jgi:uncharacterized membrane protein
MVLVALVLAAIVLAIPGRRWRVPGLHDRPARMRAGLAAFLMLAGTDHLLNPWRYLPMMPLVVPVPRAVVLATGLAEIAGALGLLVPATRRAAGWALAIYFVCVWPANFKAAIQGITIVGLEAPNWAYWARLALQPGFCWWALFAAGAITWPAAARSPPPMLRSVRAAAPPRR